MEKLIDAINNLANALQSVTPQWMSIVEIFAPITLTVISIVLSVCIHKQNKSFQKILANRDQENQTRQYIIDIYNTLFDGLAVLKQADGNVAYVLTSYSSCYNWALKVEEKNTSIIKSYNGAKLLIDDDELIKHIECAKTAFNEIYYTVNSYIFGGSALNVITDAWTTISRNEKIQIGDYVKMLQNSDLSKQFVGLCESKDTQKIQEAISTYINIVEAKEFDEAFKKYVQINKLFLTESKK